MFKMVKLVNLFFDINNLTIHLRLTILQVGFQKLTMYGYSKCRYFYAIIKRFI